MLTVGVRLFVGLALMLPVGCGEDTPSPTDTSAADTAVTDTGTADTAGPSDTGGHSSAAALDILDKFCARCHDVIPPKFTDDPSLNAADAAGVVAPDCAGKTVAECNVIRMKDGSMPNDGGCATDGPDPEKCPSAEDIKIVEDWVAAGAPI